MQLAHAASDSALVLSALVAIRTLINRAPLGAARHHLHAAAIGLGFMALAASTGTLRFLGADVLIPLHGALSSLATCTTMPLLGAAAVAITRRLPLTRRRWTLLTLALVLLFLISSAAGVNASYGLAIGALGTLSALYVGLRSLSAGRRGGSLLAGGAVLVLLAGLAVGTEGTLGPISRIDLFHVMLAAANLAFAPALVLLAQRVQAQS